MKNYIQKLKFNQSNADLDAILNDLKDDVCCPRRKCAMRYSIILLFFLEMHAMHIMTRITIGKEVKHIENNLEQVKKQALNEADQEKQVEARKKLALWQESIGLISKTGLNYDADNSLKETTEKIGTDIENFYKENPQAKLEGTIEDPSNSKELQEEIARASVLKKKIDKLNTSLNASFQKALHSESSSEETARVNVKSPSETTSDIINRVVWANSDINDTKEFEQSQSSLVKKGIQKARYAKLQEFIKKLFDAGKVAESDRKEYKRIYNNIPSFLGDNAAGYPLEVDAETTKWFIKEFGKTPDEYIQDLPNPDEPAAFLIKPERKNKIIKSWQLELKLKLQKILGFKGAVQTAYQLADLYSELDKDIESLSKRQQSIALSKKFTQQFVSTHYQLLKALDQYNALKQKSDLGPKQQAKLTKLENDIKQSVVDTYQINLDIIGKLLALNKNNEEYIDQFKPNGEAFNTLVDHFKSLPSTLSKIDPGGDVYEFIDKLQLNSGDKTLDQKILNNLKNALKEFNIEEKKFTKPRDILEVKRINLSEHHDVDTLIQLFKEKIQETYLNDKKEIPKGEMQFFINQLISIYTVHNKTFPQSTPELLQTIANISFEKPEHISAEQFNQEVSTFKTHLETIAKKELSELTKESEPVYIEGPLWYGALPSLESKKMPVSNEYRGLP